MNQRPEVYLNRFPVRSLDEDDLRVFRYRYFFEESPENSDIYKAVGRILYQIGYVAGARLDSGIITSAPIEEDRLQGEGWHLQFVDEMQLKPESSVERKALEQIFRKHLRQELQKIKGQKVERAGEGLVWWDESKIESSGDGWQVLKGALVDVAIDENGQLNLEIDTHYRFYSPWTLHQWLTRYPDVPVNFVRNVGSDISWYFLEGSEERPEDIDIKDLGITLADYHRNKGVSEQIIQDSFVVYVRSTRKWGAKQDRVAHLSKLLQPSVSMEVLSYVAEQGDRDAENVLTGVRKSINERLSKGQGIAKFISKKIYGLESSEVSPQKRIATLFTSHSLIARNESEVKRANDALNKGCLRTGETQFGYLNLLQEDNDWPEAVKNQLSKVAKASGVSLELSHRFHRRDLPESDMERRRFWSSISDLNIKTMLVVSPMLGNARKAQFRREALQAGIALQFMRPMRGLDQYRAANVTLGLLVKAGWQPIGMKMPADPQAADLCIGFDAGTNKKLFYGTSAFAVLANGQSLGWEIPEAQLGESFSSQAIWEATSSIVERFYRLNNRNPGRIFLLRDGFVRDQEFDYTINNLEAENIAVDLLEVHKSGAGRMAKRLQNDVFHEVDPGTGFSIADDAFRIVTSQAHAGGSARPLEVVKIHGDASLRLLANEIFALSQFHPASAFRSSRLPMPLHYADRMIKEVQRLGQLSILHGIDRQKLFFA
ncbi:argonaute PAZ domain-containing protein [Lyngbya confervoides]|uniref:Protein argonaute n=1 Tax=Lyngbya confervoides BDU141951 TaxID=1574623 RepID=A0ABD4T3D6_9CYAN|nr:argonaute PAZ domain-containing protein [Lyngbya confervoides]MCM1983161.1 argonaute PAZ domain-containing protein [Lyngbya confervoides BDU141951]